MSSSQDKQREQLSAYLDGELSPEEAAALQEALAGDEQLAAELAKLEAVRNLVAELPRQSAPAGLVERVLAQAERASVVDGLVEMDQRAKVTWAARLSRMAAAAAVLIAVGIGASVVWVLSKDDYLVNRDDQPPTGSVVVVDERDGDAGGPMGINHGGVLAGISLTGGTPVVISMETPSLEHGEREMEAFFASNSIIPEIRGKAATSHTVDNKVLGRANSFNRRQASPRQVTYVVEVPIEQVHGFVKQLNNLRANQNLSQVPFRARGRRLGGEELAMVEQQADQYTQSRYARGSEAKRQRGGQGGDRCGKFDNETVTLAPIAGKGGAKSKDKATELIDLPRRLPDESTAHLRGTDRLKSEGDKLSKTLNGGAAEPADAPAAASGGRERLETEFDKTNGKAGQGAARTLAETQPAEGIETAKKDIDESGFWDGLRKYSDGHASPDVPAAAAAGSSSQGGPGGSPASQRAPRAEQLASRAIRQAHTTAGQIVQAPTSTPATTQVAGVISQQLVIILNLNEALGEPAATASPAANE